jgi:hypothetical protein
MPLSPEQKKLITDASLLSEIEKMEHDLSDVTQESIGRKTKVREYEKTLSTWKDKLKKLDLDPDADDLEEQLNARLEKGKKGMKPDSEFEALMKKVNKLTDEVTNWKTTAEKNATEAAMAKARSAFAGKLTDHFGKASDLLLDYATLKGIIAVKDEMPGVMFEDDFVPLNAEKGQKSAIDVLKKLYPDFAITKQVGGGKDVSTRVNTNNTDGKPSMQMADFEAMTHPQKQEFIKSGGKVE